MNDFTSDFLVVIHDRVMETAPTLPDFPLALKPDDYQLPPVDNCWNENNVNGGHLGPGQLKSDGR